MGIVRTQSIVGSVMVYAGAGLGFVLSALIFPHFLKAEQIGLISLLVTYSALFAQFASAGFCNTITKMFPYFRDEKQKHNEFLFFTLAVVSIASILMIGVYFIAEPFITQNNDSSGNLLQEYAFLIVPMFIFTVFFNILECYTKALFNAVRGIFLKEILLRIFILALVGMFIAKSIDFQQFVYGYVLCYGMIFAIILFKLITDRQFFLQPNFALLTKPMRNEIWRVSLNGIIISSASIIVVNIDRIMIEKLIFENPLAQVGIYTTCTYFATMVILPNRPLQKITSTLVAEAWKRHDMENLQVLYNKSTITQLIIGMLVFTGLCINLDYIFQIIPQEYASGKWVIIFIGIFYLSDMAMGVNRDIVSNSPKYFKLTQWTIGLIVLIIVLNFVFIPDFGISGAAISSCCARLVYNFVSFFYVKRKFGLQPFNHKHTLIILLGLGSLGICYLIPETPYLIANIAIKSISLTVLYSALIYVCNASDDVNELANGFLQKIGLRKKRN